MGGKNSALSRKLCVQMEVVWEDEGGGGRAAMMA